MKSTPATKKPRGRPATGVGTQIQIRLQPQELAKLDAFRGDQTRPAAIRAILEKAL